MPQDIRILEPVVQSFGTVASASRSVLDLDPLGTYYCVALYHTFGAAAPATKANFITNVASIKVNLGGTTQWDLTPAEIIAINEEKQIPWVDGILPLWFSQPDSLTPEGEDFTSWGMADIATFQIIVQLNACATPTLDAHRLHRPANITNGQILTTDRQTVNAAGLTTKTVDVEIENGRVINAIYAFDANIDNVKAYVGNDKIFEADKAMTDYFRQVAGYDPQADMFIISGKQLTGRFTDVINGQNAIDVRKPHKLRLEFTYGGGVADHDLIIEQIGPRKA